MANIRSMAELSKDERYMARCIQLALNAEGGTYPNPMVGAVVVCDDVIIGEGWHRRAGEAHAEVNAINSVRDKGMLGRATIYVSLEPCAHQGRTPPCADLIVRMGLRRVVVGCRDTFAKVDGRGIARIREAGIEVTVGVLEEECRWLNRRFFTVQEKGRPYVILKWAETGDGYIGDVRGGRAASLSVSGWEALAREHRRRCTEDGILVGGGTVRADDPMLTPRWVSGPSPRRFVLTKSGEIGAGARVLTDGGGCVVINGVRDGEEGSVKYVRRGLEWGSVAREALGVVGSEGVTSVIVEGGARVLGAFIEEGLWDEAYVYVGDGVLGHEGVRAPRLVGELMDVERVGGCVVRHFRRGGTD